MSRKVYTAGECFNYEWTEAQVLEFIDLWDQGVRRAPELAEHFDRHECEIAILVMDMAQRGFITKEGRTKRRDIFADDNPHDLWREEWSEKKPVGRPRK